MRIIETKFKDLKVFDKQTFKDNRGFFRELFLKKHIKKELIFDVMSLSKKKLNDQKILSFRLLTYE